MSGFNYAEPDDSHTTLTAIRSSSGLFYIQAEIDADDETLSVSVRMSPDKAMELARWIMEKCALPEELEFVLPCELAVGSTRFGKGVKVSAAQGAIHRLYERMRLQESRLGELCYKCKLAIFPGHDVEWKNLAPDAASGGTVVAVHRAVCPAPAFAPSPLARRQEKPDADGWIAWAGGGPGEMPVSHETPVEVRWRDGSQHTDQLADYWSWGNSGDEDDIVAYRLSPPQSRGSDG